MIGPYRSIFGQPLRSVFVRSRSLIKVQHATGMRNLSMGNAHNGKGGVKVIRFCYTSLFRMQLVSQNYQIVSKIIQSVTFPIGYSRKT